ncbi:MAG: PTS sugar transporter subunit IIC [Sporolactobacillus sp.]|jgi:PTS system mannose-specific IIC component|nr:PTS sugar transporter subunit IIC [Sporolactobacillus sp.]
MGLAWWQITLLVCFAFFEILDSLALNIGAQYPVISGTVAGLICGDPTLGMAIGATLQLMVLGVGTYGGASIPDFVTGSIVSTAFASVAHQGTSFAIGLAIPVGLLMVQLDVLARFTNVFFLHRINRNIEKDNLRAVERNVYYGAIPWGLSRAIPVFIMLIFGKGITSFLVNEMPDWLMGGLKVAGGILPVVGIAILLRYLPAKKFVAYLMLGFIAAAYLKVPMLGVALIGLALAVIYFRQNYTGKMQPANGISGNGGGSDDGEYED